MNVWCALLFMFRPEAYAAGFEMAGVPGTIVIQAFGVLFLMWNATYPPVLWAPSRHRTLFAVILAQQAIAVAGEVWLWAQLPPGHAALLATGVRFLWFDAAGLVLMGAAYAFLRAVGGFERDATGEVARGGSRW